MGTVRKVVVEYLQDFLMVPHEKLGQKQAAWRSIPTQSGIGGTLGDVGTHCVNLLEYVTGDPIVNCAPTRAPSCPIASSTKTSTPCSASRTAAKAC